MSFKNNHKATTPFNIIRLVVLASCNISRVNFEFISKVKYCKQIQSISFYDTHQI
jgi:hypothetical protein